MLLKNLKTGDELSSPMTHEEALKKFHEKFSSKDGHWLWYWIHKMVLEHKDGDKNTSAATQFLGDSFILAIGYGLKRPMIRCHFGEKRYKFYLSKQGTVCIKSGWLEHSTRYDPAGREEYIGCLRNGQFMISKDWTTGRERELLPEERDFLTQLEASPTDFLAKCGRDMDRCCYCNLPLEDSRSKEVGYGPICASHWGLPWGKDKAYMEKAPSFSKIYDKFTQAAMQNIRQHPKDDAAWEMLADWIEVRGLPRVHKPAQDVCIPKE